MRNRAPRRLAAIGLTLLIVAAAAPSLSPSIRAAALPAEALLRLVGAGDRLGTGRDGRLTILLLGSDARGAGVGLLDTIMVVSLKGNTISAASIPRDSARIPNPDGGVFAGRINAILKKLLNGRTLPQALAKFSTVIEHLLQIEIDYYAMLKMKGFDALVAEVEPVPVRIRRDVRDSRFWDDPTKPSGVYFPAAANYRLHAYQQAGHVLCNGLWKARAGAIPEEEWCRRALPFVRSRKGPANSDFARARRQQDFVLATVDRVLERGEGAALTSLLRRASGQAGNGQLTTSIPLTAANALDLYRRLSGARVGFQVVFSPSTYAKGIAGSTAFELNLPAIRRVTRQWFGVSAVPDVSPTQPPSGPPAAGPTSAPDSPPPDYRSSAPRSPAPTSAGDQVAADPASGNPASVAPDSDPARGNPASATPGADAPSPQPVGVGAAPSPAADTAASSTSESGSESGAAGAGASGTALAPVLLSLVLLLVATGVGLAWRRRHAWPRGHA